MSDSALQKHALDCLDDIDTAALEEETQIVEWGKWSRGGLPTGKPGIGETANISDEMALLVDRQVAKLPGMQRYIVEELYKVGRGVNELSRKNGMSTRKIRDYRDQALNRISGGLQKL